jgi:crossover junction endodeoxyribonuclease RusA
MPIGGYAPSLEFHVPLVPPSVNMYVRHTRTGRHYVTSEAKAFKAAIPICASRGRVKYQYYSISICITLGKGDKLDLDNCAKVVLDGLVEGGQIHSDAAVTRLILEKKRNNLHVGTYICVWEGKRPDA